MNGTSYCKEPIACTESERLEFARLVRQGFQSAAEGLDVRIRQARRLAFHYATGDTLVAVAALKAPSEQYRDDVFEKADATVGPEDYDLELGWVFVVPTCRRHRIANTLCRLLLEQDPNSRVFATTRTDNNAMIRILDELGFVRVGRPYVRRDEQLVLYVRSDPTVVVRRIF